MRRFLIGLAILASSFAILPGASVGQALYASASEAAKQCPSDIVVWVNTPTRIYHYPGTRWYGRTKQGAFVCEKEAKKAGMRPALNGQ